MTSIAPGLNKRCASEATLEAPDRQIGAKKAPGLKPGALAQTTGLKLTG